MLVVMILKIKDILQEATAYDLHGNKHVFTADELNFSYEKLILRSKI